MNPRTLIRGVRLVLILAAVVVASIPLVILLDLAGGGTGLGLCPQGIGTCRNPYSEAPELSMLLTVGLFVVLGGIRVATLLERRYASRDRVDER